MEENRMLSDEILLALIKKNGGGGGGTDDYNDLKNQPKIENVTLKGNKTAADLGLATAVALATKVDKVEGKGLSTNDFTDTDKTAIGDNTTAIEGIKNGENINSFSGVESALALKQNATDNSLDTDAKTIVGAINEHEGDIDSLKSGLTNYQAQNKLNLEVPDRKNVLPMTLATVKAANTDGTWSGDTYTHNGISFAVNTDSDNNITSIDISGTNSDNSQFNITNRYIPNKYKNMILNGYNGGSKEEGVQNEIYVSYSNNGYGWASDLNCNDGDVVLTKDYPYIFVMLLVRAQTNFSKTVYPMIRPATITDPTFAPYIPSVNSRLDNLANPLGTYNVMGIFQTSQLYNNSYGIAVVTGFDPSIHTATINSASTLDGTELTLTYNQHSTKKGVIGFFVADATVLGKIVNINITVS